MQLAICEFLNNNYTIHKTISLEEFYTLTFDEIISDTLVHYNYYLSVWSEHIPHYTLLQNWNHNRPLKVEIITITEPVCMKTYYLRCIQHWWKKLYSIRTYVLLQRKKIKSLRVREITGKWPKFIRIWPKKSSSLY